MSQLLIKGHKGQEFKLNVIQFRSPMSAAIDSVQTKTMLQHFPIRAGQPDINFTCRFPSIQDKHLFQAFVRDHQINAQTDENGMVTLWWPERNIENWTGYIVDFRVREARFEYAPTATFGVALIASLMSERTKMSSFGSSWTSIWGPQIPPYAGPGPLDIVNILRPPTPPSSTVPAPPSPSAPGGPNPPGGVGGSAG